MSIANSKGSSANIENSQSPSKLIVSAPRTSSDLAPVESPTSSGTQRLTTRSLNRPLVLKHRKLRPGLPPTVAQTRPPIQKTIGEGLHRKGTSVPKKQFARQSGSILNGGTSLYLLSKEPGSAPTGVATRSETDSLPSPFVAALPTNPTIPPNSLKLRGDYWEICYENRSTIIDDSRGLRYVALLIQHTREDKGSLYASELVALAKGVSNPLVELSAKEPLVDNLAENQITKRLEQIAFERNDAVADGDYDQIAALDAEVEQITAEFERLKGHGRKKAMFNHDGERARKAVSKAIADTTKKLAALPEMESFARHLTETIRKGQWLSYNANIEWQIEFSAPQTQNSRLPRQK